MDLLVSLQKLFSIFRPPHRDYFLLREGGPVMSVRGGGIPSQQRAVAPSSGSRTACWLGVTFCSSARRRAGTLYVRPCVLRCISGLVAEYIVAIDVTRVRFPADASYLGLYTPTSDLESRPHPLHKLDGCRGAVAA